MLDDRTPMSTGVSLLPPSSSDAFPLSATLFALLAPQHHEGQPYHVYDIQGEHYQVRPFPANEVFPDFWWRHRGRVLYSTLLPSAYEGHHALVTFFQFNAVREEVFQTAHVHQNGSDILMRASTAEQAREHHEAAFAQLKTTLPLSDEDEGLPSWL